MDKFEFFGTHNVFTQGDSVYLDNFPFGGTWVQALQEARRRQLEDEDRIAEQIKQDAEREFDGDGFATSLVLGIVVLLMAAGCIVAAVLALRGMA